MTIQIDSRKIKQGDIFICLPGGEPYIQSALDKGASKVLKMTREELASFAKQEFNNPSQKLFVIGVTGTNGKTTVTQLVGQVLEKAGYFPYVSGTLSSELTTPESIDIQRKMAEHLANGGTHFVMEVSSHSIAQHRILGIDFDVKLLTNITQDHLDFHKSFENYRNIKMQFLSKAGITKETVAIYPEDYKKEAVPFVPQLLGGFNYKNIQAALSILKHCDICNSNIYDYLSKAKAPPGRFEIVSEGQDFIVIVDYAHTPDGLENILLESSKLAAENSGKLITVFGSGGDRDRGKRPQMAEIAEKYSNHVLVTQDNPRGESEQQIIDDILQGFSKKTEFSVFMDRKEAVKHAITLATTNDVVVIAGKGHEEYQIFKNETIHFSDKEEAALAIKEKLNANIN
jgi:UDP-N-acetylmuramoyl-L-alanyl-D-glutamate--2,6-diaminopimelate ligase